MLISGVIEKKRKKSRVRGQRWVVCLLSVSSCLGIDSICLGVQWSRDLDEVKDLVMEMFVGRVFQVEGEDNVKYDFMIREV